MQLDQGYEVIRKAHIQFGQIEKWAETIMELNKRFNRIFIICDSFLQRYVESKINTSDALFVNVSEDIKSKEFLFYLFDEMELRKIDKSSLVLCIGGGALSDVSGMAASVYKRGIPFAVVPTTLLAAVDAAMGGKNGINHHGSKNQLGTIQQPIHILYDLDILRSISIDRISEGLAEVIKYAFLYSPSFLEYLEQNDIHSIIEKNNILNVIEHCVAFKMKKIQEDELDASARKELNFGHTFGHALETSYHIPHGQAVALGMIFACHISIHELKLKSSTLERLVNILSKYELPICLDWKIDDIQEVIMSDKKMTADSLDFIGISEIGKAKIYPIPKEQLLIYLKMAKEEKWIG